MDISIIETLIYILQSRLRLRGTIKTSKRRRFERRVFVRFGKLTGVAVIINQQNKLKIGTCYENMVQSTNYVQCMI